MEKACRGGVICEHTGSAGFFYYDINRMILLVVNERANPPAMLGRIV